jgi:hypothetical protein
MTVSPPDPATAQEPSAVLPPPDKPSRHAVIIGYLSAMAALISALAAVLALALK